VSLFSSDIWRIKLNGAFLIFNVLARGDSVRIRTLTHRKLGWWASPGTASLPDSEDSMIAGFV